MTFSVPVSKLPDLVYESKRDIEEAGLLGTILGHVGDGELHPVLASTLSPDTPFSFYRKLPCPTAVDFRRGSSKSKETCKRDG